MTTKTKTKFSCIFAFVFANLFTSTAFAEIPEIAVLAIQAYKEDAVGLFSMIIAVGAGIWALNKLVKKLGWDGPDSSMGAPLDYDYGSNKQPFRSDQYDFAADDYLQRYPYENQSQDDVARADGFGADIDQQNRYREAFENQSSDHVARADGLGADIDEQNTERQYFENQPEWKSERSIFK